MPFFRRKIILLLKVLSLLLLFVVFLLIPAEQSPPEFKREATNDYQPKASKPDKATGPTPNRLPPNMRDFKKPEKSHKANSTNMQWVRYQPIMTLEEKANFVTTLRACVDLLRLSHIQYLLYGGSLVGWYRHAGKNAPWDDDIDMAILPSVETFRRNITAYKERLQNEANQQDFIDKYGRYGIAEQDGNKLKCFSLSPEISEPMLKRSWRWPFVDIFLMEAYSNSKTETVFDVSKVEDVVIQEPWTYKPASYPAKWIFPLKVEQFEGVDVFVPHDVPKVLWSRYDLSICESLYFSHRLTQFMGRVSKVNCTDLASFLDLTNMEEIMAAKRRQSP